MKIPINCISSYLPTADYVSFRMDELQIWTCYPNTWNVFPQFFFLSPFLRLCTTFFPMPPIRFSPGWPSLSLGCPDSACLPRLRWRHIFWVWSLRSRRRLYSQSVLEFFPIPSPVNYISSHAKSSRMRSYRSAEMRHMVYHAAITAFLARRRALTNSRKLGRSHGWHHHRVSYCICRPYWTLRVMTGSIAEKCHFYSVSAFRTHKGTASPR